MAKRSSEKLDARVSVATRAWSSTMKGRPSTQVSRGLGFGGCGGGLVATLGVALALGIALALGVALAPSPPARCSAPAQRWSWPSQLKAR